MINRCHSSLLKELGDQFPAVLIVGPRQCGKTTLAKEAISGRYFDLEKPSDQQVFLGDPELALRRETGRVVLDEAQTMPELFPVLRALIDEDRRQTGRYYLLGSVNPALVRPISETLAGRVGVLELTPFLRPEVRPAGIGIMEHWLRGGYPDACLDSSSSRRDRWQDAYMRTFVERDLPRHGLKTTPIEMRRFLAMMAHLHGGLLNASDVGRAFGLTYHTVQRYLDVLEGNFLVRRLPPFAANIGKRLVKAPKVYVRDAGTLHHLLGIREERDLLASPRRGFSWEGFMIEQVIALEQLRRPGARFSFYRTHTGTEIDLVVEIGMERTGYEFKAALSVKPADGRGLKAGLESKIITRGFVVHLGERRYPLADAIEAVGAEEFLGGPDPSD